MATFVQNLSLHEKAAKANDLASRLHKAMEGYKAEIAWVRQVFNFDLGVFCFLFALSNVSPLNCL